jgi:hypothetical protein
VLVDFGFLVGAEVLDVETGGATGHGGELSPWDIRSAVPQRDQLGDLVTVARDGECLPVSTASIISLDLFRRSR